MTGIDAIRERHREHRGECAAMCCGDDGFRQEWPCDTRIVLDALDAEVHDVQMLARNLSLIYDEVSGGRISKPNTYPSEVISVFNERLDDAIEEAEAERDAASDDADRLADIVRLVATASTRQVLDSRIREAARTALAAHEAMKP